MLSRFWLLRGWEVCVNPLNEVLKNHKKMIPSDIKVDAKQEIKELVATSYNV